MVAERVAFLLLHTVSQYKPEGFARDTIREVKSLHICCSRPYSIHEFVEVLHYFLRNHFHSLE